MRVRGRADDGAIIELTLDDDDAVELERRWPPFGLARIDGAAGVAGDASGAGVAGVRSIDASIGWDLVESELGLFAAERLEGLVAIHAAMLVHDGRAILVPGPSRAGKTTLALAAIKAGVTVASDEYALFDLRSGLVHGWPRPLRIRRDDGGIERRALPPSSNGRVPVAAVAAIRYDPDGPPIAPISRADATIAVLENCVCGASRPTDAFDAAVRITAASRTVAGCHADAAPALQQLLELLGGRQGGSASSVVRRHAPTISEGIPR